MKRYLIVVEKANGNYSAHLPDIDGCIATGDSVEETLKRMQDALTAHLELMTEDGDPIPESKTVADYVEIDLPEPVKGKPR